ncbi:lon protease homolog 2, peroxisomal [Caerostris extrusa]|uniref:Lon protease homolog 2, peroxisomal n=1 Tax=Caerostris extrusa TaxID=172846 RepID=A0AAV4RT52_CAEEX|nr:lon protease homolog 2, peroxisomal [Caerostris extrusa]
MVRNHLLSRSTLSSAIIGVVPREIRSSDEVSKDGNVLHSIGTAGIVIQVTGTNWPRPAYTLLVTGLCRFKLERITEKSPYLIASVRQLDRLPGEESTELDESNAELSDLMEQFREQATKLIDMLDLSLPAVVRLKRLLNSLPTESLPDVCAAIVRASHTERLQILDAVDLAERFKKTLPLLVRQIESSISGPIFSCQVSTGSPEVDTSNGLWPRLWGGFQKFRFLPPTVLPEMVECTAPRDAMSAGFNFPGMCLQYSFLDRLRISLTLLFTKTPQFSSLNPAKSYCCISPVVGWDFSQR